MRIREDLVYLQTNVVLKLPYQNNVHNVCIQEQKEGYIYRLFHN
jgi:hypothetical protein